MSLGSGRESSSQGGMVVVVVLRRGGEKTILLLESLRGILRRLVGTTLTSYGAGITLLRCAVGWAGGGWDCTGLVSQMVVLCRCRPSLFIVQIR